MKTIRRNVVRLAAIFAALLFTLAVAQAQVFVTNLPMITARYNHTATLLLNGKVLVAGGNTAGPVATNTCELYDPATGIWTNTGSMITPRNSHTATLLPNG